jgi:hypothetical protein
MPYAPSGSNRNTERDKISITYLNNMKPEYVAHRTVITGKKLP